MDRLPRILPRKDLKGSSTSRSFFSRGLPKSDNSRINEPPEQPKGPLGLTTLYVPEGHVISDLIFVHGLNGGSESTWSRTNGSSFWPQKWLPYDDAFKDVRIHTFGYPSGLYRESVLNIQDFAASLLSAIQDSPSIAMLRGENVPLVLVGHSMGGLVIKKAYILGCQNPAFESVVNRVRAIFFLATPHQGADIANTLSRLLSLVPGSRPFVNDLLPQSPVLQGINEEFPRYSSDLQLFSFYETKPMFYGAGRGLIVEKNCAVMNYTNERRTYLDANHRETAKFVSPVDPNYLSVRNALATLLGTQRERSSISRDKVEQEIELALARFLGILDIDTDEVLMQDQRRLQGSGVWLLERESFRQWRDAYSSRLMWLRGRPGAGKSFLAGNIVKHLRELSHDCCCFFFTASDNSKTTIGAFLRSMAFQMSRIHPEISDILTDIMTRQEALIDKNDHSSLWRLIYLSGILKVKLSKKQYWIVDAMDECKEATEILSFLGKVQESWPLCIFVTSRTSFEPSINKANPVMEAMFETITEEDSNRDINLFLRSNIHLLKGQTQESRDEIIAEILSKSRGCFLWANLVLNELRQVHTSKEAHMVLASNPSDMDQFYSKILDGMSKAKYGKDLTKSILTWVTCSFQPLSTDELRAVLFVDIHEEIEDIEHSVTSCCGNLVYIDSKRRLQLIHLTAKEFLANGNLNSEFAIEVKEGHGRLAKMCLEYLINQETSGAHRSEGASSTGRAEFESIKKRAFKHYASSFLFQHVSLAKSYDDQLTKLLAAFLMSTSVLTWIEHIARNSDLQKVYQAGKTILNFLSRQSQHTPPIRLQRDISLLDRWGHDLLHLVTRFSQRLILSPSSIHHIIPPFCPPASAIRKQFIKHNRGVNVHGLMGADWDECLTTISYGKGTRSFCAAAGPDHFALGMSNGEIIIYDDLIFQETRILNHQEPVWRLKFGHKRRLLASAGAKSVRVWNLETWEELWAIPVKSFTMALSFIEDDLILAIAAKNNMLMYWDMISGSLRCDPADWTRDLVEEGRQLHLRQPTMAAASAHQMLMAVIYRGEDILLWDLEKDQIHDIYEKETGSRQNGSTKVADGTTTVRALTFSDTLNSTLLAAAYNDGDLIVYDTFTGNVMNTLPGANVTALASSPDGRTLAGADTRGSVVLYDFETLKSLHCISFDNNCITAKTLAFTMDGQRLIDVRAPQCRVWQPPALLRQDVDDESSNTISVTLNTHFIEHEEVESIKITVILCAFGARGSYVFCGKEDGSVHLFDISIEPVGQQLFVQTASCPILRLHFDDAHGLLTASDASSRVTCRELSRVQRSWRVAEPCLDIRPDVTVVQVLGSRDHSRLVVSSEERDDLWDLKGSNENPIASLDGSKKPRWSVNPSNTGCVLRARDHMVEIRSWNTLEYLAAVQLEISPQLIDYLVPLRHPRYYASVCTNASQETLPTVNIQVWDYRDFQPGRETATPVCALGALSQNVEVIIGVYEERLVYIDALYWVCSVSIGEPLDIPVRHFFIPNDWLSLVNRFMVDIGKLGEIMFVKQAELAVIKRGLEVTESGASFRPRQRGGGTSTAKERLTPGLAILPGRHTVNN